MAKRREILQGAAALGAAVMWAGTVRAEAQEVKRMRRPKVLFFDSNEQIAVVC